MSDDHKRQLETQLWNIANDLRGNMDAAGFRDYILGFIFYKYLSEKIYLYANELLTVKPKLKDRKPTRERVLTKVIDYVDTFIKGVAA